MKRLPWPSIALACVIGIALAACFFIGLSGGFRP
jgi:hypothetical protein